MSSRDRESCGPPRSRGRQRYIGVLAAGAASALLLAACGSSSSSSSASGSTASNAASTTAKKHYTIAVTVNTANSPYPAAQLAKTKQLCQQDGLTCDILDPELNAVTQNSQLETAITDGVNAVLYFPVNIDTERPILLKLKAAHIPVINWGSRVKSADSSLVVTYAGENSTYEGSTMGKQLCADAAGKPTNVAIVTGLPGSDATVERTDGFMTAIKACPNVRVVASEPGNFDQATALTVTADMLQSHPDLQAIYSEDDVMGLGVLSAVKSAHDLGKIKVYGVGGEKQFVAQIAAGNAQATVGQDPWSYAEVGIRSVLQELAGQHLAAFEGIAAPVITKANAATYVAHW
jgi:ribose transport system substrate-binding protein